MSFLLPFVCFLCMFRNSLGHHWNDRGSYAEEISYQDILDINGSCYPLDSCYEPRQNDPVNNYDYMCSCHSQCWEIGTCCIDSPYRGYPANHKCVNTGNLDSSLGYHAINVCPDNTPRDSVWKGQCETEWNGEDDILMLSPVTSLATSKTYRNYYCFKCHETTDEYVSWNIYLESDYNVTEKVSDYRVAYDSVRKTWMTIMDNRISIPVNLTFQYPEEVFGYNSQQRPMTCDLRIIKECAANWTDARIRDKCLAYTAVVYYGLASYKNVHCALCNYKTLDSLTCRQTAYGGYGGKGFLNFQHLLNINSDGFDKAGSDGKCEKDHMWDPYGKKCRKKSCALPGYVIKDDRCVPP